MNISNPYYVYGRIVPSHLLQKERLEPSEAFKWYFQPHIVGNASHLAANREAYIQSLDTAINANDNLHYLPTTTKLMVTIPVSGSEGKRIYETLKLYTSQSRRALRYTQFVLIVNQAKDGDISEEASRQTYQEIVLAQKNFPELSITLLSIHWPKNFAKRRQNGLYSASLKIVTDTCMRAAQKVGIDPLIITNDANPRALSKNYLLHYLQAMHDSPKAEVFLGKIHWGINRMRKVPGYGFVATVLMAAQDRLREGRNDMPLDTWAANSGYRASALAALGGVDGNIDVKGSEQGFGADIDLGRRFFAARRSNETFTMVHGAWVDSYGDRLLRQYLNNKSLTRAWDECDNNASSHSLKLFVDMSENIAADFDHIKHHIESLLSLMVSDQGWACFDNEAIIAAAMNTVLLGSPEEQNKKLWSMAGERSRRKVTFTIEGERCLRDVLPQLADIIQEGLITLDDMMYAALRENDDLFEKEVRSSLTNRQIGSHILALKIQ